MTSIVTRATKGAPLSYDEVDANFLGLNADKVENSFLEVWPGSGYITTLGTITSGVVPAARISGLAASATIDTTNASNITTGTLNVVRLPISGVSEGTYKSVTVDSRGRVISGTNPTTLGGYGITDAAPIDSPAFVGFVDLRLAVTRAATPDTGDSSTKVATTAYVQSQNYLRENQLITVTGDATGSGKTSITLTLAPSGVSAGDYTKVSVNAKGLVVAGGPLSPSDIPTLTAAKISDFDTQVRTNRIDQLVQPAGSLNIGNQKIINLLGPDNPQDAATKGYVDSVAQGMNVKDSVRVATTQDIILFGLQNIDGVIVGEGDRVLVKSQTLTQENGIYAASAGNWSRTTDMDNWSEVPSAFTFVGEGSTYASTGWVCVSAAGGTLNVTPIVFTQFSGAGTYSAGAGLFLTGSSFSVNASTVDTGVLTVSHGGTGSGGFSGIPKANGTAPYTAAVPGTDYLAPSSTIDGGSFGA